MCNHIVQVKLRSRSRYRLQTSPALLSHNPHRPSGLSGNRKITSKQYNPAVKPSTGLRDARTMLSADLDYAVYTAVGL